MFGKITSSIPCNNDAEIWIFERVNMDILNNLEIFPRHVNSKERVLFEDVGNFRGFRVFDLALMMKSKTWKTWKFCVKWIYFIWGS